MNCPRLVGSSLLLAFVLTTTASAQVQDSDQQRCLNKVSGSARKVTSGSIRNAVDCMKKGAAGNLPMGTTAQECLFADLKDRVDKARVKVDSTADNYCVTPFPPDFGFVDSATTNDSHESEGAAVAPDCFGPDLDAALAGALAGDAGAKCSTGTLGATAKLADAMLKEYLGCMKRGLKDETITAGAGLDACLDVIHTDVRSRISKSVERVEKKLASATCTATPSTFFPELDGPGELCDLYGLAVPPGATDLATCLRNRMKCRVCRIVNGAQALSRDCDQFDDGSVNGTCPECPNGTVDGTEECDDGNSVNGDGCTDQCVDEFCGDAVVNDSGAEDCDDGPANSDTAPNACRLDCSLPSCGDGVVDDEYDEVCDEGGATPTCDADCTLPSCGDGITNPDAGEQCDDANTDNTDGCLGADAGPDACHTASCGDGYVHSGFEDCDDTECCSIACEFSVIGTPCTGMSGECMAPQCNGSGSCVELPASEGSPCEDGEICTAESTCQSGTCTATEMSGVGLACGWAAVGATGHKTTLEVQDNSDAISGDWCGLLADVQTGASIAGNLVTTGEETTGPHTGAGIIFSASVTVGGDIITNDAEVDSENGLTDLPGLVGVTSLAAGQDDYPKDPAPTFYDTTGADPRVAECQAAQASLATTKALLDSLPQTADFGNTYKDLPASSSATINAVNIGGLNVFDMTHLSGSTINVTVNLDGGGDPDTVFVLRIATRLNTGESWTWNVTNGLTYDHLLFYVSDGSGTEGCAIGINNTGGGGTLFCPDMQIHINTGTPWSGALYGGDSGTNGSLRLEGSSSLTYVPFTAALP